jgi:hypothetical protein
VTFAPSGAYKSGMQRVLGLPVLVVCASLSAGCGGSALQAKARKVVGDPHATVVSTQTVEALNGARLAVVVMRPGGAQGLGCLSDLMPGPYRCPRSSDAYVELNPTTHADGGESGISRFQVAAIAKARRLSPRFLKFPAVDQLTVRCAIPGGSLRGMCATVAMPFGKPVRCVAFTEAWRPSAGSKLTTRGWVVTFSRDGQVTSARKIARPPQPWAGGLRGVRERACLPRVPRVHPTHGAEHIAYAYELPIDPKHPKNGLWSTFVRMRPVSVGYRIRGVFPREWVVVAVKPLPRDGQQAGIRGWRGKKNPIWHGRLVLRPAG